MTNLTPLLEHSRGHGRCFHRLWIQNCPITSLQPLESVEVIGLNLVLQSVEIPPLTSRNVEELNIRLPTEGLHRKEGTTISEMGDVRREAVGGERGGEWGIYTINITVKVSRSKSRIYSLYLPILYCATKR